MGGNMCTEHRTDVEDPFTWTYDSDPHYTGIKHTADLTSRNKDMQNSLEQFVEKLKADQRLYKDSSMGTDPLVLKSKTAEIKCTYERPFKFLPGLRKGEPYEVMNPLDVNPDCIQVNDQVMQYFGAFLCFLADKPHLIQKIITTEPNTYGLHTVEAYREGTPHSFIIDDYILCSDGKPVFSQPCKMRSMWPCLVEKAWLKIKGNTAKRVEQTSPEELFQTFVPVPIDKKFLDEADSPDSKAKLLKIFEEDKDLQNKSFIFVSKKSPEHDIGLSGRRYFYLLKSTTHEGKKIFYLRNPCGDMAFRGMYADVPSPVNEVITKSRFDRIYPGNFVIDEDQVFQQISQIIVIHENKDNDISSTELIMKNWEEYFVGFDVEKKGNLSLKVSQFAPYQVKNQEMNPLTYHVVRLNDQTLIGGQDNREGCFGVKNTHILDEFFDEAEPGDYLIRLKKKSKKKSLPQFETKLMSYFPDHIKFDTDNQSDKKNKWEEFLAVEARRQLNNSQRKGINPDIAHVVCWLGDLAVIYVQNLNKRRNKVSVEVNFPQLMNLECLSHPELNYPNQWRTYEIEEYLMFIFEKIDLTGETHIRQYHLESF